MRGRHAVLQAVLEEAGLKIAGGTSLFVLVDDDRADALHRHLCRHPILTRKFHYAPRWLRIGLCRDEDDEARLHAALAGFAGSGGV